jgi:hypothetical protein
MFMYGRFDGPAIREGKPLETPRLPSSKPRRPALAVFLAGLCMAVTGWAVYLASGDVQRAYWIFGLATAAGFGLSGVLLGAWVSGDRVRENSRYDAPGEWELRTSWGLRLFLFGLPNLLSIIGLFLLTR